VLVNDRGVALRGGGHDPGPAAGVAEEIAAAGGTAVADDTDVASVEGGEAVVAAAIDAFGRVDSVVHNAGISRPMSIPEFDPETFESVLSVHLRGAIGAVKGAFASMPDGGNVTLIVSGAGLNPEWPNTTAYACAKAAVYALMKVAATEGAPLGVRVNAVSPFALTRMSEQMLAGNPIAEHLDPARVAPVVIYLASDLARDISGRVLRVEGTQVGEVYMTKGPTTTGDWTPETLAGVIPGLLTPENP
jgi:NAD(P)-dependent dehydrogenase (short-subunit alcohol dehydrogenase family)